jgi:hypothetical protein
MRARKFIGSIFIGSICVSFLCGVGETLVWGYRFVPSKPWGEPPPDDSPYGATALFTDAAPTKPRTPGACIQRDKSRFWLQTAKLIDTARSAGGFREALTQNLPLLPWRWRQRNPNSTVGLQDPLWARVPCRLRWASAPECKRLSRKTAENAMHPG